MARGADRVATASSIAEASEPATSRNRWHRSGKFPKSLTQTSVVHAPVGAQSLGNAMSDQYRWPQRKPSLDKSLRHSTNEQAVQGIERNLAKGCIGAVVVVLTAEAGWLLRAWLIDAGAMLALGIRANARYCRSAVKALQRRSHVEFSIKHLTDMLVSGRDTVAGELVGYSRQIRPHRHHWRVGLCALR